MKKRALSVLLALCLVLAMGTVALADDPAPDYFTMEDFGSHGESWYGAFNVGWRYNNEFDVSDITAIEVGIENADHELIIKYTASGEQLAYQKANGYVNSATGQSSAPFYKEYQGAAIEEGADEDWTVEFGPAFDKWDVHYCYVTVTTADGSQTLTGVSSHVHNYDDEVISPVALASAATDTEAAKYFKTCSACGAVSSNEDDTFAVGEATSVFAIQDFNTWGDSWKGAFNVGWKYAEDFDTDSITGLEVGMKDADGNTIISYIASEEQVAWQKANGYITADGLSSAPFYKEYNGTPIKEGADSDWTVTFGEAFDKWDAFTCYVTVTTYGGSYTQESACTHVHNYDTDVVSDVALKSEATVDSPAVYYKTCSECGAISSNDENTFTHGVALKDMFKIEDVNLWGDSWFGAFNVGWTYDESVDTDSITGIEVGLLDGNNNVIIKYTASGEQLVYQKENGYINSANQSSAPFYKEYNGTAIKEGADSDWTVTFGSAFDKWDVYAGYVSITINGHTLTETKASSHEHHYTEEIVSDDALMSGATTSHPAVYYKTCPECGAIASDSRYTFEYGKPLPVIPDTYPITIEDTANGEVDTSLSNASRGSVITVTVDPDEGYSLGSLTVTGPDGRLDVTRVNATTYRFTMPEGEVTVRATFTRGGLPFTDVAVNAWYYDAVSYAYTNGLMDGVSVTASNPDGNMTRAMVWAILARLDGETVTGSDWVSEARAWAMAEEVSDGTEPNAFVTREQLVTMLWRYAGEPAVSGGLSSWRDAASVSDWAQDAMVWALDEGIITGVTAVTLDPQGTATRAQCAAILMRYAENV